eukprot:59204_1
MDFVVVELAGSIGPSLTSDMMILRTHFYPRQITLSEFNKTLQLEKKGRCLHQTIKPFREVSKQFSVGFNINSGNIIDLYRQEFYYYLNYPKPVQSTVRYDPSRMFFNKLILCVDCMLKLWEQSPLYMVIEFHRIQNTHRFLSGIVSWLKLLYYPPMQRKIAKAKSYSRPKQFIPHKASIYFCQMYLEIMNWSLVDENRRLFCERADTEEQGSFVMKLAGNNQITLSKFVLKDFDAIYCMSRITIYITQIAIKYWSIRMIVNFIEQYTNIEFDNYFHCQYYIDHYDHLKTFCVQCDIKDALKLCWTFLITSIIVKYPNLNILCGKLQKMCIYRRELYQQITNDILKCHRSLFIECHLCHKKDLNNIMKLCRGCKVIYYCSKHCQKLDWKYSHRVNCRKISNIWWRNMASPQQQLKWQLTW